MSRLQTKPKPCKGTTSATKGLGCGKMMKAEYRVYGLGKMCGCYPDWLMNSEQGKIKLKKAVLKASKPREDLDKAIKEKKSKDSLTWLIKNTVNACHDYIKKRDEGKPCVSCGQPWKKDHHAGHLFKAELFSTIKFHEYNIHNQCVGCNIYKDGNESKYRANLHTRLSQGQIDELNKMARNDKKINHKWDRESLKEIRNYYKMKIKKL